jgi:L,D-transpeptidase YcbB
VIFVISMLQSCKKDPKEMTKPELLAELASKKNYPAIVSYAAEAGVDTSKFKDDGEHAPVFQLLEVLGYGYKPRLRYVEEVVTVDTSDIWPFAEALFQGKPVAKVLKNMEPGYPVYITLKEHYRRLVKEEKPDSARIVAESLNAYRWIHRQSRRAPRFVVVNLRGPYLKGMDSTGKQVISMRTIVGKLDSPTPTMDSYATSIVTHPYWHVPRRIALNEILPKVQANKAYLSRNNIAILDRKGEVVNPDDLDWESFSIEKFPYRFRQETGEDNSLGLLKVEIKNPLAIYLHDTNVRSLFKSNSRWRSHGCVRVQHPTELANFMAGTQLLDSDFLTEPDTISRPPKWHKLKTRIPVFLLYMGADCDESGHLTYYPDVYKRGFL